MAYKTYIHTKNWTTQKPPLGSQINWAHPLSQGLVGCWLMNEGGGKILKDLAGNNNGVITTDAGGSGVWRQTSKGQSLYFQNVAPRTAYVTCGNNPANLMRVGNPCSLEFMFLCNVSVTNRGFFRKGTSTTSGIYIDLAASSPEKLSFNVAGTTTLVRRTNSFSVSVWHHWVITWDGSTNASNVHIYIDGREYSYDTTTNGDGLVDNSSDPLILGFGSSLMTYGNIGFTRIWNRILTPQEIQSLYVAPYQMIQPLKTRRFFSYGEAPPVTGSRPRRRILINCLD